MSLADPSRPTLSVQGSLPTTQDPGSPIPESATCAHCGLPAVSSVQPAFCCNGCRGAYELIHGWGLDAFYELRDASATNPPNQSNDDSFFVFDDNEFLGNSAPRLQTDGLLQSDLTVLGLHCAACAWLIESVATRKPGWMSTRVRMHDHSIRVVYDPKMIRLSEIARLLDRVGYELAPKNDVDDSGYHQQNRTLLVMIAIAGFCAANAMWIAVALYAGDATGLAESHRAFLCWIGTGLGIASVAFPGRTFFVGALASLRTRTPHMDLPVALGLSVGSVAGIANIVTGRGEVYFDSLAVLVFLLLIGRWVQFRQQHRAAQSVDLMLRVTPRHARRVGDNGECALVLAERLLSDDVVRVAAGDSVPADGVILRGESLLDRSLLTGESRPVRLVIGDAVEAGLVNLQSEIDLRVTAIGKDSRIGRVMQAVEDASSARTPIVQLADRLGALFVVVVATLAFVTFAWWIRVDWQSAASNATALLIVACPCALALATPLAIAVALARSARRKIFIRDGGTLGQLAKPGTVWFDKTGTLTRGRPTAILAHGNAGAIAIAASVEASCHHPIANAICVEATRRGLVVSEKAHSINVELGGISGVNQGQSILVGNHDFMIEQGVFVDHDFEGSIQSCIAHDSSPIVIAIDGIAQAVLAVEDVIKPDAAATVRELQDSGWRVGILSGDHSEIVGRIGARLGIPADRCLGGLSPEDKLQAIRSKTNHSTTVMVGDGANDAAALAAADVGIAVRGGAEVSLRAAPVFIASGELSSLGALFVAAVRATRLIYCAMAISLAYNCVAVALAMSGHISPLVAAILMPISSISVLSLCLAWPIYRSTSARDPSSQRQCSSIDPLHAPEKEMT